VGARPDLSVDSDQGRISGLGMAEAFDEVKAGRRNSHHLPFVSVAMGEGVATTFVAPDLYSTEKSKPRSLPNQWC
jgi:hypothetical protein